MSDPKRTIKKGEKKDGALIVKQGELKFGIQDWRGVLAIFVVVSFTFIFGYAALILRDLQIASLVGTIYSGMTSSIIAWYFFVKSKEEARDGQKKA